MQDKSLTIASFEMAESFATGLFCLKKLPEFTRGPEFLLREGSPDAQPAGLPSSPPARI